MNTKMDFERYGFTEREGHERRIYPGEFSCPYHYHQECDEMFIILEGSVALRTTEGFKVISAGDSVYFERGVLGAHQLYNHTSEVCVYMDFESEREKDICVYPDSNKIGVIDRYSMVFTIDGREVSYYEGEDDKRIKQIWKDLGCDIK